MLEVCRTSDRVMAVKIVLSDNVWTIVSAYTLQVGCDEDTKNAFWNELEAVIMKVPHKENLVLAGDLNGHVGESQIGFERWHGGFSVGERNEEGETILHLAQAFDLAIAGVDLGGIPLSRAPQIFRRNTRFAGTVIRPDYQLLPRFGDPILGLASLD